MIPNQLQKQHNSVIKKKDIQQLSKINKTLNMSKINQENTSIIEDQQFLVMDKLDKQEKQKKNEDSINKSKLKKGKNEELTCWDFIILIRTDPEMQDEFCYLNKRNHSYDFIIVDFKDRDHKEYMTLSSRGITHYIFGIGDFIKIEDWEKEAKQFEKIKKIQFFKEYKIWKNFFVWKKQMRLKMMRKCQRVLLKNLYILDPYLQKPLIEIRELSVQLTNLDLMNSQISDPITINQFQSSQDNYRETNLSYKFLLVETQIKNVLVECCKQSLQTFKLLNRIPSVQEQKEPLLVGDEIKKDMPFTQQATIKTHYKRLRKLVKMVDYMNLQNKLIMVNNSVQQISQQLQIFSSQKGATVRQPNWIICQLNVQGNQLNFKPNQDEVKNIFNEIITKGIDAICIRNRYFMQKSEIKPFLDKEIELSDFLDLRNMIQNDKLFQQQFQIFQKKCESAVLVLQDYHEYISPFMKIYEENINMQPLEEEINLSLFKELIQKYQHQDVKLNVIESVADLGMFQIEASKLKEMVKNCAHDCLESLYIQLPQIMINKSNSLLATMTDINHKLNWTVNDSSSNFVEYFVNYNSHVNRAQTFQTDQIFALNDLNDLLKLIQDFKIKIPENYKQKNVECNKAWANMKKKVYEANAQFDQILTKCTKKLERQVPELFEKIRKVDDRLQNPILESHSSVINHIVDYLQELKEDLTEILEVTAKVNRYQKVLAFDISNFEKTKELYEQFEILERLWNGRQEFYDFIKRNSEVQFQDLDFQNMESFCQKMKKLSSMCLKDIDSNEVTKVYKSEVTNLTVYIDTLRPLLDPALGEKQWNQIRKVSMGWIENDPEPFKNVKNPKYTFKYICESGVTQLKDKYIEIALQATKEIELIKLVDQLELFWKEAKICSAPYKNQLDAYILKGNEDMISRLDDMIVSLNNILGNRFVESIKTRVEQQLKMCLQLQELLDEWHVQQNNFMYLEPILNTSSSQMGLQKESNQFKKAEKAYRQIMKRAKDLPFCKNWCDDNTNRQFFQLLKSNNKIFEQIQKALDDYLEKKREHFQRFCFLSNLELLEILSMAKQPKQMIPHLKKIFENLVDLQLDEEETTALAMISNEGESLNLKSCSMRGGEVEEWMHTVEESMRYSIKIATRQALINYETDDRKDWIVKHICQVTLTVDSINWTRMAEDQYLIPDNPQEDDEYFKMDEFVTRIVLDLEDAITLIRTNISEIQRINLIALVTQDVHYRDIVQQMYEEDIKQQSSFLWIQQMKFYWEDDQFFAKMVTSTLSYGYEFLGSFSRLVITPLTDRCWMTITNAFHQKLGANPAGPAGTGKTESCKDLAKVLGRFCLVFNCSDQINVKMMEKLFIGIASTGSWTCLDEFNRIDIEVLSVVASQFLQIREALLQQLPSFNFFGKNITLNQYMGCFITFNPGYAGRTELPENLKLLFRPVSMMVPDYALIAENLLYSEGFSNARDLGRKIQILYKLLSEQLSNQDHYDFGMRSVKSVLVMASQLKRFDRSQQDQSVLIKSLVDSNVPRLVSQDIPIFMAIIQDLFPGYLIQPVINNILEKTVQNLLEKQNFCMSSKISEKIQQIFETQKVRFGFMLVGQAFTGKTTLLTILRQAMTQLREENPIDPQYEEFYKIESQTFNPKSITIEELYGNYDPVTQSWSDGIASKLIRQYTNRLQTDSRFWVIFDGPVDSFWVENMNSVLDDSMILCLSNGERIKLHSRMRIIFEVQNLAQASPATVSRCGVVYISSQVLKSDELITSYFNQSYLNNEQKIIITKQLEIILPQIFAFLKEEKEPIITSEMELTQKLLKMFEFMLSDKSVKRVFADTGIPLQKRAQVKIMIYCINWGLGSHLSDESQIKFLKFAAQFFAPNDLPKIPVFDVQLTFQTRQEGEFISFQEQVPLYEYHKEKNYFEQVVPTKDTVCYSYILRKFLGMQSHIFITGVSGTGKSIIVDSTIKSEINICDVKMCFSTQTSCQSIQENLEYKLVQQRKKGHIYLAPPPGKNLVMVVDDINMPVQEKWGAHPPIELLRQLVDLKGVYDKQGLYLKELESIMITAIAAHPGGGRSVLTQRFTRHFSIFNIQKSSDTVILSIFLQIVRGYLKIQNFKAEIIDMTAALVNSTLLLYNQVSNEFHPTYEKSHYCFSLRDVSKVFQGILLAQPASVLSKKVMAYQWAHESLRVFHDKLINLKDQDFVVQIVKQLLLQYLNEKYDKIDDLYFVDFMHMEIEVELRLYEHSPDFEKLTQVISEVMKHESQNQLVLFKDAVKHIVRLCRTAKLQNGHMVIVGVGGSGKRSICKLAALLSKAKYMTIEVTKKYTKKDFRADLFNCMLAAGVEGHQVMFQLSDNLIIMDSQMDDLNNLISTGEISGLIGREEFDKININLQEECRIKKLSDPIQLFNEKIKSNFHIILALSPVGDQLKTYFRKFPSLTTSCNIDWVLPWPDDALHSVANIYLEDFKYGNMTQLQKDNLIKLFVFVQETLQEMTEKFYLLTKRNVYTTPKSYLDFVLFYKDLIMKIRDKITFSKNKLSNGLGKLYEANQTIAGLKAKLIDLQPILIQKTILIKELIVKLTQDQQQANIVKKNVEAEANEINLKSDKIMSLKLEADYALKEAQPILQNATEQLDKLNRGDIGEIKQNNNPHALVKYTMECVAILLEEKTDWDHIKKQILSDASLLSRLKNLKGENITPQTKEKLKKKLISNPLFVPNEMKAINLAAKSLCEWVHAVNNFTDVYREISLKKDNCKAMDLELQKANSQLALKQQELELIIKKVQALEKSYQESKQEKESLDNEIKQTEERLQRASQLTERLADEQIRWKEQVQQMAGELDVLLGNSFLAAASIAYYGPFTGTYRQELVSCWKAQCKKYEIPHSEDYTLQKILGNQIEIRDWQSKSLSSDSISVNNAILIQYQISFPLIIDPQIQASKWIKNMEAENKIQVCKETSDTLQKTIEDCITQGMPLLIEDLGETLPSILDPIYQKQFKMVNGKKQIIMGEETFIYNDNFKLYVTTKLQNPHYSPEVFIRTMVINFTVTQEGLFEKLLGDILALELPDDDKIRRELILSIAEDRLLLKKGEDRILDLLTNSRGMILDDIELIESLKISKEIAKAVSDKIQVSEVKQEELNKGMRLYTSVAKRGVVLYFVITELSLIDPMYQFSLNYYSKLFKTIIQNTQSTGDRIPTLTDNITQTIFQIICRGLFNRHKRIFSFMMASQISLQEKEEMSLQEWNFLIKGVFVTSCDIPIPQKATFSLKGWQSLVSIRKACQSYDEIVQSIQLNVEEWNDYFNSNQINTIQTPVKSTNFQKLLLINIFKFEKTIFAMDEYIRKSLGDQFVNPLVNTLEEVYSEIDYKTPLIFILSQGADPLLNLIRFSKEMNIPQDNLFLISLGQGQGPVAESAINHALKSGGWVILQNCHLGKSFMPILEKKLQQIEQMTPFDLNPEFRLMLTAMPCDYFPVTILQNGMKLTCEPPQGLRNNILQTYNQLTETRMNIENKKSNNYYKLTFCISLFHAVVLERRKFGPIGFNMYYQFNESDLDTSLSSLKTVLEAFSYIPWDALRHLIGQINYGGRITDEWDRRCLQSILSKFCNENTLRDNFRFITSGLIHTPTVGSLAHYKNYITTIPEEDVPEIFGLSQNANLNFQIKETKSVIETILSIQPRAAKIDSDSGEEQINLIITSLEKKLPKPLKQNKDFNYLDCLEVFLMQEINKFNKLLSQIQQSLRDIKKGIKGEILMSPQLEEMLGALSMNRVPQIWEKFSYPCLKPLASWFDDFVQRIKFINSWVQSPVMKSFWMSAFYFPQGFITSILQNYARKMKLPVDKIVFKFNLLPHFLPDQILAPPLDGCYVHGLFSEGFRYEIIQNKTVMENSQPGQLFSPMPILHFAPYHLLSNKLDKVYEIPIYKTILRIGTMSTTGQSTNFVISVVLPYTQTPDYWIMQGAAIFCSLPD